MKPFNLEEAKAGKPVCTRDGDKARIICFDVQGRMPRLVALIMDEEGDEHLSHHRDDGTSVHNPDEDLFMATVKTTGYAALFKHACGAYVLSSRVFGTEAQAISETCAPGRVAIVPIEWEE